MSFCLPVLLFRFGHLLPLKPVGKGGGSRSLLYNARKGLLLHDASYWCCCQLKGPQEMLLQILKDMRWAEETSYGGSAAAHWVVSVSGAFFWSAGAEDVSNLNPPNGVIACLEALLGGSEHIGKAPNARLMIFSFFPSFFIFFLIFFSISFLCCNVNLLKFEKIHILSYHY